MRTFLLSLSLVVASGAIAAAADPVVDVQSRGQTIRAVLLKAPNPKGAVILLAGGKGRLDVTADGRIAFLAGNQLVRTRALYAQQGYTTLVPDLAPDFKVGKDDVVQMYRAGDEHARDIGAAVEFLRGVVAKPVVVIGTSRGSISAANAVAKLAGRGTQRPDALVLTSAFLELGPQPAGPTVWKVAGNGDPKLLAIPTLVAWHVDDACPYTGAAGIEPFKTWYQANGLTLALRPFSGGAPPESDPCDAKSPHGFWGLDAEVVKSITGWIDRAF